MNDMHMHMPTASSTTAAVANVGITVELSLCVRTVLGVKGACAGVDCVCDIELELGSPMISEADAVQGGEVGLEIEVEGDGCGCGDAFEIDGGGDFGMLAPNSLGLEYEEEEEEEEGGISLLPTSPFAHALAIELEAPSPLPFNNNNNNNANELEDDDDTGGVDVDFGLAMYVRAARWLDEQCRVGRVRVEVGREEELAWGVAVHVLRGCEGCLGGLMRC